jgi:hypothetical protein|tara:strand:+ start:1444 stop:1548 length:105 start_codon:yes stop_codon:yes gene_type:complete
VKPDEAAGSSARLEAIVVVGGGAALIWLPMLMLP